MRCVLRQVSHIPLEFMPTGYEPAKQKPLYTALDDNISYIHLSAHHVPSCSDFLLFVVITLPKATIVRVSSFIYNIKTVS